MDAYQCCRFSKVTHSNNSCILFFRHVYTVVLCLRFNKGYQYNSSWFFLIQETKSSKDSWVETTYLICLFAGFGQCLSCWHADITQKRTENASIKAVFCAFYAHLNVKIFVCLCFVPAAKCCWCKQYSYRKIKQCKNLSLNARKWTEKKFFVKKLCVLEWKLFAFSPNCESSNIENDSSSCLESTPPKMAVAKVMVFKHSVFELPIHCVGCNYWQSTKLHWFFFFYCDFCLLCFSPDEILAFSPAFLLRFWYFFSSLLDFLCEISHICTVDWSMFSTVFRVCVLFASITSKECRIVLMP